MICEMLGAIEKLYKKLYKTIKAHPLKYTMKRNQQVKSNKLSRSFTKKYFGMDYSSDQRVCG